MVSSDEVGGLLVDVDQVFRQYAVRVICPCPRVRRSTLILSLRCLRPFTSASFDMGGRTKLPDSPSCSVPLKTYSLQFLSGFLASGGSLYFSSTPLTVLVSFANKPEDPKFGFSGSGKASPSWYQRLALLVDGLGKPSLAADIGPRRRRYPTPLTSTFTS